ncbi:protein-glutamate methylesterase/protein-glutamine glutaminase [Kordiimonas marina]|uniref:protein-glutamate methylesterase/protein-glutamine glutaminase n=1 Tax=Kordiimonas marina TaxID=2872312 RepID=UPI00248A9DFF|nr:chemotaxis response regulator protein-glutamate methylesterase [Kordiimonas marina]MCJ9429569.1 chemotaxis response regulator protein-glutamate methylesterase [Kordiimonas marina]
MVVDDSAIIRGFLSRYLSEDPDIEVVTTANNGAVALRQLGLNDIEVVVLDIEMPEMDGLTALPKMIDMKPDIQVVMASTLTRKNAEISLRSLQMGAVDYVPKPETARSVNASIDFRRELVDKVKAWAGRRRKKRGEALPTTGEDMPGLTPARPGLRPAQSAGGFVTARRPVARPVTVASARPAAAAVRPQVADKEDQPLPISAMLGREIKLRTGSFKRPKILAVGSSTGGPQALMKFFKAFGKAPNVPILITQHMPATFTAILAEHLGQATGWPAQEARDGIVPEAGKIYVAPGGRHMEVAEDDKGVHLHLTDEPPENFCRPAVDPLFRSLAATFGERALAVVLTGMGHDGLKGARELTRAGGTVLAQDEASSVVWGMPGAVATAGLCTEVLPVEELGQATAKRIQGGIG